MNKTLLIISITVALLASNGCAVLESKVSEKLNVILDRYCISLSETERNLIRVRLGKESSHNIIIECFKK